MISVFFSFSTTGTNESLWDFQDQRSSGAPGFHAKWSLGEYGERDAWAHGGPELSGVAESEASEEPAGEAQCGRFLSAGYQ